MAGSVTGAGGGSAGVARVRNSSVKRSAATPAGHSIHTRSMFGSAPSGRSGSSGKLRLVVDAFRDRLRARVGDALASRRLTRLGRAVLFVRRPRFAYTRTRTQTLPLFLQNYL